MVIVQGFGYNTAAVASSVGQTTIMAKKEPFIFELDDGWVSGI